MIAFLPCSHFCPFVIILEHMNEVNRLSRSISLLVPTYCKFEGHYKRIITETNESKIACSFLK